MNNRTIFIGGIHGVGKTYFCNYISQKYNIRFYSASELISQIKKQQFNNNKRIADIEKNQNVLVKALENLALQSDYLLDGHFCLLNERGEITLVPEKTFMDISLKAIIVLEGLVEAIVDRLENRDKVRHDIELIRLFQEVELRYSEEISEKLNVPYLIYNCSESLQKIFEFMDKLLNN